MFFFSGVQISQKFQGPFLYLVHIRYWYANIIFFSKTILGPWSDDILRALVKFRGQLARGPALFQPLVLSSDIYVPVITWRYFVLADIYVICSAGVIVPSIISPFYTELITLSVIRFIWVPIWNDFWTITYIVRKNYD